MNFLSLGSGAKQRGPFLHGTGNACGAELLFEIGMFSDLPKRLKIHVEESLVAKVAVRLSSVLLLAIL